MGLFPQLCCLGKLNFLPCGFNLRSFRDAAEAGIRVGAVIVLGCIPVILQGLSCQVFLPTLCAYHLGSEVIYGFYI